MKVKVTVETTTRFDSGEIEVGSLAEALASAKFAALFEGDFQAQTATYEITEEDPPPPAPRLAVVKPRRPLMRPFERIKDY